MSQRDSILSLLSPALQYLGHVEVEESRGMHICEDAVKRLKTVSFTRKPAVPPGTLWLDTRLPASLLFPYLFLQFCFGPAVFDCSFLSFLLCSFYLFAMVRLDQLASVIQVQASGTLTESTPC